MLFQQYGSTERSKQVLSWIAHGAKSQFVSPFSSEQEFHARYHSKLKEVQQWLSKTVAPEAVRLRSTPAGAHMHERDGTNMMVCSCPLASDVRCPEIRA